MDKKVAESLAIKEHERFVRERQGKGWKYAPAPKDVKRKTSPWLVPWSELLEDMKEIDCQTVRNTPAFLTVAGFEVYELNAHGN